MSSAKYFFDRFVYVTDKEQYGVNEFWEEPKLNKDGKFVCDCESVAIWFKRNVKEFKDWKYWYCKLDGEGHCLLMDRTSDLSPFVIDNNTKRVVHLGEYLKIYNITDLRPYKWYELLWKFGTAKVIKIYLKARGRWKN